MLLLVISTDKIKIVLKTNSLVTYAYLKNIFLQDSVSETNWASIGKTINIFVNILTTNMFVNYLYYYQTYNLFQ